MRLSGADEGGNLGMRSGMRMQVERRCEAGSCLAEEWRRMRCGPLFFLCGLEGAGREQKEHTVRAGAIHAKIVVEPRAKDAVEAQIGRIRDREMRCGRWRMENGE